MLEIWRVVSCKFVVLVSCVDNVNKQGGFPKIWEAREWTLDFSLVTKTGKEFGSLEYQASMLIDKPGCMLQEGRSRV
jgi:hypothetical protein